MDKRGYEDDSICAEEFEALMESLHETQSPGVFSNAAEKIGWREQELPAGFSLRIMARIRQETVGKSADWRIIGISMGFFILMGAILLIAVSHLTIEPAEFTRVLSGIFWLMAGLGISMGIIALTVFTAGRGREHDFIGNKGGV